MRLTMNVDQRILSYLRNRKGEPVTNEQIAIGTKQQKGTVGPAIARLIDKGLVARWANRYGKTVKGEHASVVSLAEFVPEDQRHVRVRPMPRKDLEHLADLFEETANLVLTCEPDDPNFVARMNVLRIARDTYRTAKRLGRRPFGDEL